MDEYVGGISAHYITNEPLLTRGWSCWRCSRRTSTILGPKTSTSFSGRGSCTTVSWPRSRDTSHDVPEGNAVAGVLLSGRSSQAGRYRLALLHLVPLRPGRREVGNGNGPRASHHRLGGNRRTWPYGKRFRGLAILLVGSCGTVAWSQSVPEETAAAQAGGGTSAVLTVAQVPQFRAEGSWPNLPGQWVNGHRGKHLDR